MLGIALVFLVVFAVGVIYAQVCVIKDVRITGWGTRTAVFENHSTEAQNVRVEIFWDDGKYSRDFGLKIDAGKYEVQGRNRVFVPGRDTWDAPGIISNIRECL